jgi:hypothetical protein
MISRRRFIELGGLTAGIAASHALPAAARADDASLPSALAKL